VIVIVLSVSRVLVITLPWKPVAPAARRVTSICQHSTVGITCAPDFGVAGGFCAEMAGSVVAVIRPGFSAGACCPADSLLKTLFNISCLISARHLSQLSLSGSAGIGAPHLLQVFSCAFAAGGVGGVENFVPHTEQKRVDGFRGAPQLLQNRSSAMKHW